VIEFNDSFEVPASPDRVMQRLADVPRVAQCVPGASIEGHDEDGHWLGTMAAAFGPKKLRFAGKVRCSFDLARRTGVITGGGTAAGRGASISVRTEFDVREAPGVAGRSIVSVRSVADMQGVLAPFAAAGGAVLAAQLLSDFSAALTRQLSDESDPEASAASSGQTDRTLPDEDEKTREPSSAIPEPATLSLGGLLRRSLWGALRRFIRQLAGRTT